MPTKSISYSETRFTAASPTGAPEGFYDGMKFMETSLNFNLGESIYGWVELDITWQRNSGQPTLDVSKGDVVKCRIVHPQGAVGSVSVGDKDSFVKSDNEDMFYEVDLTPSTDSGTTTTKVYFLANTNPQMPTEPTYNINFYVGLKKGRTAHSGSFSVEYSCVKPVYQYEFGVHPYSAYDAGYNSDHTVDLYSFTPIEQWGLNTRAYVTSEFDYPAFSYYYGIDTGESVPKVFRFGEEIDRGYGTANYYKVKKRLFGRTKVSRHVEGPKSYYELLAPGSDRGQILKTCCIPSQANVGKITEIVTGDNLVQPSLYKYWMQYDENENPTRASEKAFGWYNWAKKRHYRVSGIRHALEKYTQGYIKGYKSEWDPDWWAVGASGFGLGIGALVASVTSDKVTAYFGSKFLEKTFSGLVEFIVKNNLYVGVGKGAVSKIVAALSWIVAAALLLYFLWNLFKSIKKTFKEPCLQLERVYHANPYIKVNDAIWNDASQTSKSYGLFTDGIQNYIQTSLTGVVNTTTYQGIYSCYSQDPISFEYHSAPRVRTGTKIDGYDELVALLYVAGIPVEPCTGTTYYSTAKSETILTNAGALETCPPGVTVDLPAGYAWSCISQSAADNTASRYFQELVNNELAEIRLYECDLIATHGEMDVEFTHELKVETHQNECSIYWNTASYNTDASLSDMIGATMYYDERGLYKVMDGYYCNSQPHNGPGGTDLYKVFYELVNGVVVDVWVLSTSSSNSATSQAGNSPRSLSTVNLDYRSDWFIEGATDEEIRGWLQTWTTDPYNLVQPIDIMSEDRIHKGICQDTDIDDFVMKVYDSGGSQWVEAEENYYGELTGWVDRTTYTENKVFLYVKTQNISVHLVSKCPTSSVGLPYGVDVMFTDSSGEAIRAGVDTTFEINCFENSVNLETRTVPVRIDDSVIYSPHQSISTSAEIDEYTFTDLPKTVGKRTFVHNTALDEMCNPIEYDVNVSHSYASSGDVTTVTVTSSNDGLGLGTFYYTDLANTVSGSYLASGTSNNNASQFTFTYTGINSGNYIIDITTPNGKNTTYEFEVDKGNTFTGLTYHGASYETTYSVSNWTINQFPVTFKMNVFGGTAWVDQSTSVRFRLYNNVGGILLNDQTVTSGPPGYSMESDTYTLSSAHNGSNSYQWIVEVTGTTGSSLAGYGFVEETATVTPTSWSPSSASAWIDASDTSSYSTSGSTLTSVTDKAGTYTMSVGGTPTTSNTLNSLNVFTFDGNNEYLQSTSYENQVSSGNHWAIGVFRYDGTDNTKDSFWSYETNQTPKRDYAVSSSASNNTWPGELDLDGLSSNRISSTIGNSLQWTGLGGLNRYQWYIVAVYFNKTGNQIGLRFDGRTNTFSPVNDYDNSLSSLQELRLMRNRSSVELAGQMAEFMSFAALPGTGGTDISEIEKAEGYLAHKWGLTGNLLSTHPYKNTPPTS